MVAAECPDKTILQTQTQGQGEGKLQPMSSCLSGSANESVHVSCADDSVLRARVEPSFDHRASSSVIDMDSHEVVVGGFDPNF